MADQKSQRFNLNDASYQILAACIVHSIVIPLGVNMAYSTILLPQIMFDNSTLTNNTELYENITELRVDKHQATWIASLVNIATPIGSLLVGPLMDRFGRKTICLVTEIPFIISWALIVFGTADVYMMYVARTLAGIGGGLSVVSLVYVAEIAHPLVRPMLLPLGAVFVSFGILITTVLGAYLHYKTVAIYLGLLSLFSFFLVMLVPESPHWLSAAYLVHEEGDKKVLKKLEKCIKWFYRKNQFYEEQFNLMSKIEKKEKLLEASETPRAPTQTPYYKQVLVLLTLFILQQFTGCYVVIFYAVQIFKEVGGDFGSGLNEFDAVVLLGVLRFLLSIITVFLAKVFGRRVLLLSSGFGMFATLFTGALYIHFAQGGLIPVILILASVSFSAPGYMIIPWTLIGEMLPQRIRGTGSGFIVSAAYTLMFITVKIFIYAVDYFGIVAILLFFCCVIVAGNIFIYYFVPETLNKTFKEIEDAFYKQN